ncbi:MAG: polysaccharide biosynthesis C-terminal domain-containing protein [Syntrophorhabdaceae bacterium]|nr:polysaccharide biosynthesis C-terminal domain-containing protein [Syntrophorhabdaceae bacterium]
MGISLQILRNILSNWGSFGIGAVIQFMMMPFLVHRLGDMQYGIWILIMSFTGYLGLFDFGVSGSVVKYVAEFRAKNDNAGLNRVCSAAFYMYLAGGTLAFLVSILLAFGFVQHFKIPSEEISTARWVTMIVGLQIGLTLPLGFFTGYMRGMQRYDHVAGISLAMLFVRSIIIILLVLSGYRLIAIALVHLVTTIGGGILRAVYVFRANPDLQLRPALITRDKLAMVSRYSFLMFLYFVATNLIFSTGSLVIGYFLTAAAITFYAIPQRLVDELRVVIMSTGVLQPAVSHLNAQGRDGQVQRLLVNGTKYSMMIVLPIAVSYLMVGDIFISLWMGPRYAAACYGVLVILTCAVAANISQFTSTQILQGIARHSGISYIAVLEGAANVALSVALVRPYGIVGVAVGTLIPMLISNLIVIPWYTCRTIGLSLPRFFGEGLLRPCIPALFFGAILYAARRIVPVDSWTGLIATLAVCLALYAVCAWYLCLSKNERITRWADLSGVIRSCSPVIRSLVLLVRSRPEKSLP